VKVARAVARLHGSAFACLKLVVDVVLIPSAAGHADGARDAAAEVRVGSVRLPCVTEKARFVLHLTTPQPLK
jgi:hypothetical protein